MKHAPQPAPKVPAVVCRVCGRQVQLRQRGSTRYWTHVGKGPEIVYGSKLRESYS